jgi:RHS repeat-associated protein
VLDYDGTTGTILRWYAYGLGPNALLSQIDVPGSTRTMLLPDQLGSIIGTVDGGGTLTSFAYRSYGSSVAAPAQFGYTGQRVDAESGNYYYRARHYSPALGRFLQADPIGHQGGMHLYAYTANDPLNAVDPDGLLLEAAAAAVSDGVQQSLDSASNTLHAMALDFEDDKSLLLSKTLNSLVFLGPLGQELSGAVSSATSFIRGIGVAAEGAEAAGEFSLYDSTGGLKGLNTNVTADEFSANLRANGYSATQTTGTNGAVSVLQNGQGSTWTIYTRSSTVNMGAQFIGPNGQFLKYNLGVQGLPLPGP